MIDMKWIPLVKPMWSIYKFGGDRTHDHEHYHVDFLSKSYMIISDDKTWSSVISFLNPIQCEWYRFPLYFYHMLHVCVPTTDDNMNILYTYWI